MIDTHCHLTFTVFQERIAEELEAMREAGVRGAITVVTTSEDAKKAAALQERHECLWHSSRMHPLHSDQPVNWGDLRDAARSPRCVAWGELGLDRHYSDPPQAIQRRVLEEQLDRVLRWNHEDGAKPVIVHCRDAFDDLLPVLAASGLPSERFVFHCFTGTPQEARRVLDFGAWISFTGVVTYANAPGVAEAATLVPEDRIMVETDAPFLSPEPIRTARPNRPAHVVHVARFLARLRAAEEEDFFRQLDLNACRFFGLPAAGPEALNPPAARC